MSTILVTGATGTVGTPVLRQLALRPEVRVRAFVRDQFAAASVIGDPVGAGAAQLVTGDFADRASLDRALDGVDVVYLACGNVPEQVEYECRVIDAAEAAGVHRIVKLSAHGAGIDSPVAFWRSHDAIEQHLHGSAVPATILRPTFNMANLLGFAEQIAAEAAMFLPAAGARVAMVDPRDVAAAAVSALMAADRTDTVTRTYVLTGPAVVTFEDVAAELAAVLERTIRFIPVTDEAARVGLTSAGLPAAVADQVVRVFQQLRIGVHATPTRGVRALTGREPRAVGAFVRAYAGAFRPAYPAERRQAG